MEQSQTPQVHANTTTENTAAASTGAEVKPEAVNQEQATPADKTNLEQLISETSLLIPEGEKQAKDNAELATAVQAAKPVLEAAQAVFADAAATAEQVAAQEAALRAANKAIGDQLALLSEDGTVSVSLTTGTTNSTSYRTDLNIRTDYNVAWDTKSIATRSNDIGLSWVESNGSKALVYKYNVDDSTAFTSEDILKLLKAIPTDVTQRTLLGTEKKKAEGKQEGYSEALDARWLLNNNNIQVLDITDTTKGWGGRTAADTKVRDLSDTERRSFTVPAKNGVPELTINKSAGEKFQSYSELILVNTNAPVSKPSIKSQYVGNDTQTNLYNVYLVGYKPNIETDIKIVNQNNTENPSAAIVPTPTTTITPQADGDFSKVTKAGEEDYPAFFVFAGQPLTEADSKVRFLATDADGPLESVSIWDGNDFEVGSSGRNHFGLQKYSDVATGVTGVYGSFNVPGGDGVTWYARAVEGGVVKKKTFLLMTYDVERKDNHPVRKSVIGGVTAADIIAKVVSDTTKDSGTSRLNATNATFEEKFNTTYTAIPEGKATTVTDAQKVGKQVWHEIEGTLPTTVGKHEVIVKSTNIHGQVVRNTVVVELYEFEEIQRDIVNKYTDNPVPVHAIVELGSTGQVGTVKLEGNRPADFAITDITVSDATVAELAKRNLEFVRADAVGADGTVGIIRAKDGGKVEYTGSANLDYKFTFSYREDTTTKTTDLTYTILYTDRATPVMKPAKEYVRVVGENYTISVPGSDNAFLKPSKIDGILSVLKPGDSGLVSPSLGTATSISSSLDPAGYDISGGKNDQNFDGDTSTKFNVNIAGTAPTEAGTGTYKLRVGEDNFTASPRVKKEMADQGLVAENVGYTDITVTFVDKIKPIEPIPVVDQANLTPEEKAAVIKAVKDANPNNAYLQNLPDTAFTVNDDGSVSVNYTDEAKKINGATDTLPGATATLANYKDTAKDKIDDKLAEEIKAIDDKKAADIQAINAKTDLTDAQKAEAVKALDDAAAKAKTDLNTAADTAKANIDAATTPAEATAAKSAGDQALTTAGDQGEKALDLVNDKIAAKDAVDDKLAEETAALTAKKDAEIAEINNNPDLTPAQKDEAIKAIEAAATTQQGELDKAAADAKTAIDAATTPEAVAKAQADGEKAVAGAEDTAEAALDLVTTKATAKDDIDDALAKETAAIEAAKQADLTAIDNNPNLTPEQKQAAKDAATKAADDAIKDLTAAADDAKKAIEAATDPTQVNQAKAEGEKALELEAAQAAATNAINDAQVAKTADLEAKRNADLAAIEAANLTPAEETAAKDALNKTIDDTIAAVGKEAADAKDEIAAATSPADVATKQAEGLGAINTAATTTPQGDQPLDLLAAKVAAKDAINDKLADELQDLATKQAEAEAAIDASSMTPEEKAAAKEAIQDVVDAEKAKLEQAAAAAKQAIDAATSPADVKAAAKAGETALTEAGKEAEKAVELAKDKELAKEAIRTEAEEATKAAEKLAEDAIKAINDNPNLTDAEKQAEIAKVNDAVNDALDAIAKNAETATNAAEQAKALADLEAAKKAQKDADKVAIDTATPLVEDAVLEAAKQDALNKLEKDATQAAKDIAANPNLTEKQVEKALADLAADLKDAQDKVNAATTPEKVQAAEDKGVDVIAGDVLEAARLDALNKLAEDTKETVAAIESNPNLTADEKAAAIAKVEEKADDAKSAILLAESPADVQAVEEQADKDLAKEELKAAADDAKKAIDANPNLTPEEKQVAKDAVDAKVKNATDAIDAATTPADVNAATLAGEKELAKAEVAAATDDAKKAIAANPNLTPEEKQAAKDALDAEVAKATEAIDKAPTPADVNAATLAGEKVAAKAEVAAAADDAKKAIAANPNLTPEEKQAAKDALDAEVAKATEAIDKATTPADVNTATLAGEKVAAKAEVKAAADDAIAAIKSNPNLDEKAKAAAIKAVEDAAKTATEAIDKAATPADVNATTLAGEQAVAKEELKAAAADAIAAINANPNLDEKAKAAAIKAVEDAAKTATEAIDKAATPADVNAATLAGEQAVAKEELKAAAADAIEAIKSNPNLDEKAKTAAINAVTEAAKTATEAIDKAATPADVNATTLAGE
ncbi:DUF1542 domain-containing protein [Streptococcus suis]